MTEKGAVLKVLEKKIHIDVATAFDPKKFFKTREGLYVWSDFDRNILKKAEETKGNISFELSSYKFIRYAYDKDIEAELPEKHIFTETEVCALIAELISRQLKSEEGVLLNDGWWNLFYTPNFVVSVYWYARGSGWRVSTWVRDGGAWDGGGRVFSPAN